MFSVIYTECIFRLPFPLEIPLGKHKTSISLQNLIDKVKDIL